MNALVGGMLGQERTVLPLLAQEEFGLTGATAAMTFIVAFGLVKAITNFFAGTLSDRFGRKPVLVAGWLFGLPVPLLLIWAPSWGWVIAANVLLGINQGLAWSTTVIMKIDLAGPHRRGLAMGLNEAAGYMAVSATALLTGFIAARAGLRPEPFYVGIAYTALGLGLSTLAVRETRDHAAHEAATSGPGPGGLGHDPSDPRGNRPDQFHRTFPVGREPSRDGQQPQRRHGLGTAPSVLRRRRAFDQPNRHPRRGLSRHLGFRSATHRSMVGPGRSQTADRRRHVDPSCRDRRDRRSRKLRHLGCRDGAFSGSAPPWSIRPFLPQLETWPIPAGGLRRLGSTASGATPALPSAPSSPASSPTLPAPSTAIWTVAALTAISGTVVAVRMQETHGRRSIVPDGPANQR